MRVMDLTPELFEKVEFAERRRGYDTEQVETFLEEAGTALAQLLARARHTEERAAHAETRLAEAEQKLKQAEEVLAEAERRIEQAERGRQASAVGGLSEEAEVEQAAKTLLMARKTAEATVNEAKGQAQSLLEDARTRADRQLAEANAEAEELLRRAGEQAEAEFADRRVEAQSEVQALDGRRTQLADVITQLESRLAGYRAGLGRAAEELQALSEDPSRLGARPNLTIQADEVLSSEQPVPPVAPTASDDPSTEEPTAEDGSGPTAGPGEDAIADPSVPADGVAEEGPVQSADLAAGSVVGAGSPPSTAGADPFDRADSGKGGPVPATEYLDLTAGSSDPDRMSESDPWGPGSWAEVQPEMAEAEDESVRTGAHRDRFMEELDSAVNEAVDLDDDAMKAFFEGTSDSRARRFGWRR
jgi:DivIVA domain-containing protein